MPPSLSFPARCCVYITVRVRVWLVPGRCLSLPTCSHTRLLPLPLPHQVFYWSVSITRADNSAESAFDGSAVFRTEMRGREHHVVLPWEVLAQHLGSILQVGLGARDKGR